MAENTRMLQIRLSCNCEAFSSSSVPVQSCNSLVFF